MQGKTNTVAQILLLDPRQVSQTTLKLICPTFKIPLVKNGGEDHRGKIVMHWYAHFYSSVSMITVHHRLFEQSK